MKPAKIDRVKAEIQAHTYTHSPPHTHTHIHTVIFEKPCILISNTSEYNYNMFLQQLKKLLLQSFLYGEAK